MIRIEDHPLLSARAFESVFPRALEMLPSPEWLRAGLSLEAEVGLSTSEPLRGAVRDLLRHAGYKPTGRGKPSSEYLRKAAAEGALSSINAAVDACNVVSLHSGIPISVVDLDSSLAPHSIGVPRMAHAYVFNPSGQNIDVENLLCLFDAAGPCANAVKDSQRTKTGPETRRTLSLIWGTNQLPGRAAETEAWYRKLLTAQGATVESVVP